ncbi:50S ribosomal protein L10 [Candidatus Roizmanbacteria bacterium]|nr:50S ribosomal protein L10 [Candidatus Roizmanbacteria bacterium]
MANQTKQTFVESVCQLLSNHKNFVLVKFAKTPHQKLEALRKSLKNKAKFQVIKNTLLTKAFDKMGENNAPLQVFKKKALPLKETTALLLLENDWSDGLKIFYEFADKEQTLSFKTGLIDETSYSSEEIVTLAKLPSRTQLVASLLGSLKSPTVHLVFALKNPLQKLTYILKIKSSATN